MTEREMWRAVGAIAAVMGALLVLALVLLLGGCGPAVTLGSDAVRTTCETCRRVQAVCDAAAPAPSGSARP